MRRSSTMAREPWNGNLRCISLGINNDRMENYRIYCEENERAEIMSILRKYNDIVIDNVDPHSFGITIEGDNAAEFFENLLAELNREVFQYRRAQDSIPE